MKTPSVCRFGQRGAALLTAMIIVTLVATVAASMIWQQWRAVQVETAERARVQSAWMLQGALDWAKLLLKEDSRTGGPDHLGEPWAVPLAEARLSTFLAADRDNTDGGPEAFLSGSIVDVQSRYNLRNLFEQNKVSKAELQVLERLCDMVGVAPEVAARIANGLLEALLAESGASGSQNAPLMPRTIAQLAWLGVDAEALARLRPYVTLLPQETTVNLNTAPREVIAAVIEGLDLGSAERLVQARQRAEFRNVQQAKQLLPATQVYIDKRLGVQSSFFEVQGRLRLERRVLEQRSLVQRTGVNQPVVELRRERVSVAEALN